MLNLFVPLSSFAEAFADVPTDRWRVFTDDEIAGLADIDLDGGAC